MADSDDSRKRIVTENSNIRQLRQLRELIKAKSNTLIIEFKHYLIQDARFTIYWKRYDLF
jgi:hypothetical protein